MEPALITVNAVKSNHETAKVSPLLMCHASVTGFHLMSVQQIHLILGP